MLRKTALPFEVWRCAQIGPCPWLSGRRRPPRASGSPYRLLLVPLGTGAETAQAMSVACRLAADRHATVLALTVIEVPQELPLDCHMLEEESEARQRVTEARAISELYGVRISPRTLRARAAGEAIVEEAAQAGVDAIVIGAPRKQRTGNRAPIFGKTVDVVLKRAPCRVIVAALPVGRAGAHRRVTSGSETSASPELEPPPTPPRRATALSSAAGAASAGTKRLVIGRPRATRDLGETLALEDARAADLLLRPDLLGRLRDRGCADRPRRDLALGPAPRPADLGRDRRAARDRRPLLLPGGQGLRLERGLLRLREGQPRHARRA